VVLLDAAPGGNERAGLDTGRVEEGEEGEGGGEGESVDEKEESDGSSAVRGGFVESARVVKRGRTEKTNERRK
jgi:hypothetical protein